MTTLKIGLGLGEMSGSALPIEEVVDQFVAAEEEGFASGWLAQVIGVDALTVAALAGRATSRIQIGTAVVPTWTRHPIIMAQQAMTTQAACGGRFTLGIGLSHKPVIEGVYGIPFEHPAGHMRDYLEIVTPVVTKGSVTYEGDYLTGRTLVGVANGSPVEVIVAALGPKMLEIAGQIADGTITWMTGRKTIESHIAPAIREAAERAERPAPRIVAGLPVCVIDDAEAARERARKIFSIYPTLPSYRAMMDREGVDDAGGIVIAGDESLVEAELKAYVAAGVTEFLLTPLPVGESREDRKRSAERTRELLRSLNSGE